MGIETPILDDFALTILPKIIPITKPMPIPAPGWDEPPFRCLMVNAEWASRMLGMLDALDQADAWQGTDAEIFDARQNVREIMLALSGEEVCVVPVTDLRITDCVLELEFDNSGEWTPVGDLTTCLSPTAVTDARDNGCQLQIEQDGVWVDVPGASYMRTQADCAFTGRVEVTPPIGEGGFFVNLPSGSSQPYFVGQLASANRIIISGNGTIQSISPAGFVSIVSATTPRITFTTDAVTTALSQEVIGADTLLQLSQGALTLGRLYTNQWWMPRTNFNFGYTSTSTLRFMSQLEHVWADAVDASHRAQGTYRLYRQTLPYEIWTGRVTDGGLPEFAVLGALPQTRKVLPDLEGETEAVQYIARALRDFGFFEESEIFPPPPISDFCAIYPFVDNTYWTLYDFNPGAPVETTGEHETLTGWIGNDDFVSGVTSVAIEKRFAVPQTINYIQVQYTIVGTSGGAHVRAIASVEIAGVWSDFYEVVHDFDDNYGFTSITERENVTAVRMWLANITGGLNASTTITQAELRGRGTTPGDIGGEAC